MSEVYRTLEEHTLIRLSYDILTTVNAIQFDTGREFYFVLDEYEVPEDAELRVYVLKPSNYEIYDPAVFANGEVVVQPTMQMLAEVGDNYGEIQILEKGTVISSFPFKLVISPNLYPQDITSKDEFLLLEEVITQSREYIIQMDDLIALVTAQENARVEAENARVEAENARVEAENEREENEAERQENEKNRIDEFSWLRTNARLVALYTRLAGEYAKDQGEYADAERQYMSDRFEEIMATIEDIETGKLVEHVYEYIDEEIPAQINDRLGEDVFEQDIIDMFDDIYCG